MRARLLRLLIPLVMVVVLACACDEQQFQENDIAPLSVGDCITAWNAGTLGFTDTERARPVKSVGLIGRNVLIGTGAGACSVSIQLADGEVQTLRAGAFVRDAS